MKSHSCSKKTTAAQKEPWLLKERQLLKTDKAAQKELQLLKKSHSCAKRATAAQKKDTAAQKAKASQKEPKLLKKSHSCSKRATAAQKELQLLKNGIVFALEKQMVLY
jgi:hypothetical protein